MKIIVIDDSETIREQLSAVLSGAGYEIIEAADGHQGATAIRRHPEAALAICDVNMPRMSGLDMLEFLGGTAGADLPVLMLTT